MLNYYFFPYNATFLCANWKLHLYFQTILSSMNPVQRGTSQPPSLQPQVVARPPTLIQQAPRQVLTPQTATATAPAQPRRSLTLTKEQMLEAQEMFKTANKVTRPEKALILGFMAGSRDNPCPHLGKPTTR